MYRRNIVWTCFDATFPDPSFPASAVCIHLPLIFMDSASSSNTIVKKQEEDDKVDKRDIKPVPKTLNRVPRKFKKLSLEFLIFVPLNKSKVLA